MMATKLTVDRLSKSIKNFNSFCSSECFKIFQQRAEKSGYSIFPSSYSVPSCDQTELAWNVYQVTIKNKSKELVHKTFNDFEQSQLSQLVWWIENSLYELNIK